MYAEQHQVTDRGGNAHPIGLHFGPMSGLQKLPQGAVSINGMDPTGDVWNSRWPQGLYGAGKDEPLEVSANAQDPQTERDLVHLARGIINHERDLWPGNEGSLPPEAVNQWANLARAVPGFRLNLPQEGVSQLPPEKVQGFASKFGALELGPDRPKVCPQCGSPTRGSGGGGKVRVVCSNCDWFQGKEEADKRRKYMGHTQGSKSDTGGSVSGEMSQVLSKWQVVSLGELQQPGGVGATQNYNPVLDGANADDPPAVDNAQNSPEQEIALETWVNAAVDMLNRGEPVEAVMAQLSHDGCPNPQEVVQMAQQQPMDEQPVTDQIGQDPFTAPIPQDQAPQMESVSQQPPVMAHAGPKHVRIVGTSQTGIELERWEGQWGDGYVKIALDDGGTRNVSPSAIEEIDGTEAPHPVTQIQEFIDSLPTVEPTRPSVEARISNLQIVRRACRERMQSVGFSDQVKLANIDSDAEAETRALRDSLGALSTDSDLAYLSGQQTYRPHGIDYPGIERTTVTDPEFNSKIAEAAAIFVSELDPAVVVSPEATAYAAAMHASAANGDVPAFVKAAEERRAIRTDEFVETPGVTTETDGEGPAEALFV